MDFPWYGRRAGASIVCRNKGLALVGLLCLHWQVSLVALL